MSAFFLVENLFDVRVFPGHVVTGEDEVAGNEGFRVATYRRHALSYYTPATTNAARYIEVACDQVRWADCLVLDRGHNLEGETVRVQRSFQSSFATYAEDSFVVPDATSFSSVLIEGSPVRTYEGAVIFPFEGDAAPYWRFEMDAMGAGLKPQVRGLWLGRRWTPNDPPVMPSDDDQRWSEVGTMRRGRPGTFRFGGREAALRILLDEDEFETARWHLALAWEHGRPVWYVANTNEVENAWLGYDPGGSSSAPFTNRNARDVLLMLTEYQPAGDL